MQFSGLSAIDVVDSWSMASSLRPFLGVGKYSDPDSSIDDPYGASASLGQARNSCTAVLLAKYHQAGERYLIQTSETTRLSSVVQSVGIAKSSDCLLDNPTCLGRRALLGLCPQGGFVAWNPSV